MAQAYKRGTPIILELSGRKLTVDDYVKIREEIPDNVIILGYQLDEELAPEDMVKLAEYI